MTSLKPLTILPTASRDINDAIKYYRMEAGTGISRQWASAIESTLRNIQHHSSGGSPRYSAILEIENLRHWLVPGFPYIVFYHETPEKIEVWRVLHCHRDIPGTLKPDSK